MGAVKIGKRRINMTGPIKKQRSRSSSSVRLVVEQPASDKFATQYASINHLNKYPALMNVVNAVLRFPLVARLVSGISLILFQLRTKLVESSRTPTFVKQGVNYSIAGVKKLDELVNLLLFREGIDAFIREYRDHGRLGLWVAYFFIDYVANVTNYTVKEFILRPLALIKDEPHPPSSSKAIDLPHIKELSNTTKEVLEPTKEKVVAKYDNLVKPAKESYTCLLYTSRCV